MGGEEILIKSIAQAVPTYAMMVFNIPINICKGITDAISQFWWSDDDDKRRIHWQAWWKLCLPKYKGGMGFWDFHSFNLAMLAKQVWRSMYDLDYLCARVLRAKYYLDGRLLQAKLKSGSSFTWQSVLAGLECFKRGYIWRVKDGTQINIWNNNWIPGSHNLKVLTPRGNIVISTVDELINPIDGRWDEALIRSLFWSVDVHRILQIPIYSGREDLIAWHPNRNGLFTVKSAYHCQWAHKFASRNYTAVAGGSSLQSVWKKLWKLSIRARLKSLYGELFMGVSHVLLSWLISTLQTL